MSHKKVIIDGLTEIPYFDRIALGIQAGRLGPMKESEAVPEFTEFEVALIDSIREGDHPATIGHRLSLDCVKVISTILKMDDANDEKYFLQSIRTRLGGNDSLTWEEYKKNQTKDVDQMYKRSSCTIESLEGQQYAATIGAENFTLEGYLDHFDIPKYYVTPRQLAQMYSEPDSTIEMEEATLMSVEDKRQYEVDIYHSHHSNVPMNETPIAIEIIIGEEDTVDIILKNIKHTALKIQFPGQLEFDTSTYIFDITRL